MVLEALVTLYRVFTGEFFGPGIARSIMTVITVITRPEPRVSGTMARPYDPHPITNGSVSATPCPPPYRLPDVAWTIFQKRERERDRLDGFHILHSRPSPNTWGRLRKTRRVGSSELRFQQKKTKKQEKVPHSALSSRFSSTNCSVNDLDLSVE